MSISDRGRASARTLALVTLPVLAATLLAIPAWRHWRETPAASTPPLRLAFAPPDEVVVGAGPDYPFGLAAAPDGRRVVFPATKAGRQELWLIDLTTGAADALPGTEGGALPFWSPNGRELAFFASGKLRAFRFEDANVRDLADAPTPRGGAWHPNGDIIFAPHTDLGLMWRRGRDPVVEPLTTVDTQGSENSHRHPVLVNGGRHVLFFVRATEASRQGVWIASVDTPADRKRLVGTDAHAVAIDDAVVYSSDGALIAQRIDFATLTLMDRPQLLATVVGRGPLNQLFATGAGDVLMFGAPSSALRELQWVDRTGAPQTLVGEPMEAWDVRIAPIGNSVAVTRLDPQLGTLDIWTYEGERPLPRRISPAIDADESPVWAQTATQLAWISGRRMLVTRGALAELPEETIVKFERPARLSDWSPDRRWFVVSESHPTTKEDIWLIPAVAGAGERRAYAQSPFNEVHGVISPDGNWLAYASDESGRFDIYVDSFPDAGKRARLTTAGGTEPRWGRNGKDVYFRRGTEIHVAALGINNNLPEALSSDRLFDAVRDIRSFDVAPDGQRFLLNVPQEDVAARPITVLVNASQLLRGSDATRK